MDSQDSNILLKMIRHLFSGNQKVYTGYHTFLKPLPYKKCVLKFQFWMRIIPVLPKRNIF